MKIEYTPKVDSTNFALMVGMLDSPPEGAHLPYAAFTPMYLDIKWVGSFSGAATPGTDDYYKVSPAFTFAITDAWVAQRNIERNENGVPIMSLSLLDESTGSWKQINNIDMPAGLVDGQYVYVAHLEHFSTYVITANQAAKSGHATAPPSVISAQLDDSIAVDDGLSGKTEKTIEQFIFGKHAIVKLSDLLHIAIKPVAYNTLQVGKGVSVQVTLERVEMEEGTLGRAAATMLLHVQNGGSEPEQFVLNYFYMGEDGRKAYESSNSLALGPSEIREEEIKIPFTKPGHYKLVVEGKSMNDTLKFTQIDIEVPWLIINLYLVIIAAVVVLVGTAATMAILVSRWLKASGAEGDLGN
jgi:hypothetical protein